MLTIPNESNGTQTLVVGNHIIFNFEIKPDMKKYCWLDMDEHWLTLHRASSGHPPKDLTISHLKDIEKAMDDEPHKWSLYEDWEQAMIDTNHHFRVVESCMRQYQGTDYIINRYLKDDNINIRELFFFLGRIETAYGRFLKVQAVEGSRNAYMDLQTYMRHDLVKNEKGYSAGGSLIGEPLMKRRLAIDGEEVYFFDGREITSRLQKKKWEEYKKEKQSQIGRLASRILLKNKKALIGDIYITYEDVIRFVQDEQAKEKNKRV